MGEGVRIQLFWLQNPKWNGDENTKKVLSIPKWINECYFREHFFKNAQILINRSEIDVTLCNLIVKNWTESKSWNILGVTLVFLQFRTRSHFFFGIILMHFPCFQPSWVNIPWYFFLVRTHNSFIYNNRLHWWFLWLSARRLIWAVFMRDSFTRK